MPERAHKRAAEIVRKEINLLLGLAEQVGIDEATLRQDLRMSHTDWVQWLSVLRDAPLPSSPALPVLLQHVGCLTSRLDRELRLTYA
ncbi:MAG TPA: hypothetical protein VFE12_09840 [Acetobacteraceae bacterium]|jgi:hypothetical protein|nr:hypothetical protein [Acetobacteraceae bacterium]